MEAKIFDPYFSTKSKGTGLGLAICRNLADRMGGTLSAGQKRRLGLARMLVTGRPVWALDEPTVSLDTTAVGLFARAVEAHLAEGGAALIAMGVATATLRRAAS